MKTYINIYRQFPNSNLMTFCFHIISQWVYLVRALYTCVVTNKAPVILFVCNQKYLNFLLFFLYVFSYKTCKENVWEKIINIYLALLKIIIKLVKSQLDVVFLDPSKIFPKLNWKIRNCLKCSIYFILWLEIIVLNEMETIYAKTKNSNL